MELYQYVRDLDFDDELGKRTFFRGTAPEVMPVSWFFGIGKGENVQYLTYRQAAEHHVVNLFQSGSRQSTDYSEILKKVYRVLSLKVSYVNFVVFVYDMAQVFLMLQEEWDATFDELLELARHSLNPLIAHVDSHEVNLQDTLENFTEFLKKQEAVFFDQSSLTRKKLDDIDARLEAIRFIEDDFGEHFELNYGDSDNYETLTEFSVDPRKTTVVSENFEITLNYKGSRVHPENIMTVFDNLNCWERIPYIVCTDSDYKKYFKVYTGKDVDERVPYDRIALEKKRGYKASTIEFTLWLGHGTIDKTRVGSFFRAVANFADGKIYVKLPLSKTTSYKKKLDEVLVGLGEDLTTEYDGEPVSFSSELEIRAPKGFEFSEYLFQDLILTSPLFKDTIFCDERMVPASRRKIMKFYYLPYLVRNFRTGEGRFLQEPISWTLRIKDVPDPFGREEPEKRIRIFISNTTQDPKESFVEDLIQCFKLYHVGVNYSEGESVPLVLSSIRELREFYVETFDQLETAEEEWRTDQTRESVLGRGFKPKTVSSKTTQHKELSKVFPEVFGPGYPKTCKGKAVPLAFKTEAVAIEAAKKLEKDIGFYVPPLPFPPDNTKMWVVSSDPLYPYPTVVPNLDPETDELFPFVPCATKIPPNEGRKVKDALHRALYGIPEPSEKGIVKTREHDTATDKYLEPGSYGQLEPKFKQLLGMNDVYTFGVSYPSKHSLLHCVLYATTQSYRSEFVGSGKITAIQQSFEKRELRIPFEKSRISQMPVVLAKQELYNYDPEDISKLIRRSDTFFDSRMFYRFLEERYNINIFVFSNYPDENKKRFPSLEIPRCSVYHTREVRLERESLLLFRNYGPTILLSLNRNPQYEIIRRRNGDFLFGPDVTQLCYYLLEQSQTVLTWMPENKKLTLFEGIAFKLVFSKLFSGSALSQFIDPAGYMRVLTFNHARGPISMFLPPCQPLGVDVTTKYNKTSERTCLEVFENLGEPSGCTADGTQVTGLWFPYLEMEKGIFVPVRSFENKKYKILGRSPLQALDVENDTSVTRKIIKVRQTAKILKELLTFVFAIYRTEDAFATGADFFRRYVSLGNDDEPFYEFDDLPESLPKNLVTTHEAISYVAQNTKGFVIRGKLYAYNRALYDKLEYFLNELFRRTKGLDPQPATKIQDYFVTKKFELKNKNVKLFLSHAEFKTWSEEMLESNGKVPAVETKINVSLATKRLPFVMETKEGYFLTQNVPESSETPSVVLDVCKNWLYKGINSKSKKGVPEEQVPVANYVITKSQKAMYYAGKVEDGKPFLRTLVYGTLNEIAERNYLQAAMLPI